MGTNKISGAEAVIRCLLAEGVDLVYGYPGGAIMPVYDDISLKINLQHSSTMSKAQHARCARYGR
jgi:acetolactate synthase-1/2/3 large subunit